MPSSLAQGRPYTGLHNIPQPGLWASRSARSGHDPSNLAAGLLWSGWVTPNQLFPERSAQW